MVSKRLSSFGTTIFSEMSEMARQKGAIDLSQGFPDFDGPDVIIEAAIKAIRDGHNQYPRSMGEPELVKAIADKIYHHYGLEYDPLAEVAVVNGATEGIASAFMGLVNPGDEVVFFEPHYDTYVVCASLVDAVPRFYTLRFPDFGIDMDELESLFTPRTRMLVINTPHNPTGKVFTKTELEGIAGICQKYDVVVLTDEVYEHITFEGHPHLPMASIPGMRDRTLTVSGAGKTFSFTGWRIGWVAGPSGLLSSVQLAHQYITFTAPAPFQHAFARALNMIADDYYAGLSKGYHTRREVLTGALNQAGLRVAVPDGTYFTLCDFTGLWEGDDVSFVKHLIDRCSVAAIPPSSFYSNDRDEGKHLVRFAFCKKPQTLRRAGENLRHLV